LDMRTYRMGLIQTEDQLKFSYQSIIEGARQLGLINSVPTFETPVQEASDSSSEDEIPPPLPPPRTESLKKSGSQEEEMVIPKAEVVQLQDREVVIMDSEPFNSPEQFNSIPTKLETKMVNGVSTAVEDSMATNSSSGSNHSSSVEHSPNKCILTNNKLEERKREMELRRRKKEEEKSSTEEKIKEVQKAIQKSEQKSEDWKKRKEHLREKVFPFCVGLTMFVAAGYIYFRHR